MTIAFLALGSNIQPEKNIIDALRRLSKHVKILRISTVYRTEPLLGRPEPDFYNCVVKIETDLEPYKLKHDVFRVIEDKLGRKRTEDKYASRTIDIDIILYGNLQIARENLTVPDPEISKRPFLAVPLHEIDANLTVPGVNKPIKEIAAKFKNHKMTPLDEYTKTVRALFNLGKQNS